MSRLEDVTTQIQIGYLTVSLDLDARLREYLATHNVRYGRRGSSIKMQYVRLLTEGLRSSSINTQVRKLIDTSRQLRAFLRSAVELETSPPHMPRHVDPAWWAEQETERLQGLVTQLRGALNESLKLSSEMAGTEKTIKEEIER